MATTKKGTAKAPAKAKAQSSGSGTGRVTVPGLKESKGMQGFLVLPAGVYGLECTGCKIKPSDKSPCDLWNFTFKVLDGEFAGKRWGHRVTILSEQHPSFNTFGIDELKSMCLAMGVEPKGNDISPDAFTGLKAIAKIGVKMGTDANGADKEENRVNEWAAFE
jgi:hypothetical protein